jgi:glutamate--cysteine ligase
MTDFHASGSLVPIDRVDQLVQTLHDAGKPRTAWRLGTEWEKLLVRRDTGHAVSFSGPDGVEAVLRDLAERFGWEPAEERGRCIALSRDGASITLEPGAQLEISGAPFATLHETAAEMQTHMDELLAVCNGRGIAVLGLGIQPRSTLDEIEWVPKQRYGIMGPYMATVGTLGQRMMKQTATVQANIDFADEADAMLKFRVGQGIAPLVNAMFANSCVVDGQLSSFRTFRGHIWTDTDRARCGFLQAAFRNEFGFADYVEWALDVPLYFILRGGQYRTEVTGMPFRRFLADGCAGERATMDDWNLHLTTLFPEVRLKSFLEVRSADGQPLDRVVGLPALVKGIFYEPDCLRAAWDLVGRLRYEDVFELARQVVRGALLARVGNVRVGEYALELATIADEGLKRQANLDAKGRDERQYLDPLREQLEHGHTLADVTAAAWRDRWGNDVSKLVEAVAIQPS